MLCSHVALRREIPLAVALGLGLTLLAAPADAQTRSGGSAWTLGLAIPSATQAALKGGEGMSWDQFRKNGLVLSARGSGEVSLTIHALTFQDGRMIHRWTSPSFQVAPGRAALSGKYLPAVQKVRVAGVTVAREPVDVAQAIGNNGGGSIFNAGNAGRVVVMFAAPEGGIPGSRTSSIAVGLDKAGEL